LHSGTFFNGTIDEVIIYNRSLSAAEVTTLYNKGLYRLTGNYTYYFSANQTADWTTLNYTVNDPGATNITFYTRPDNTSAWNVCQPNALNTYCNVTTTNSSHLNINAILQSPNQNTTPVLSALSISYDNGTIAAPPTPPSNTTTVNGTCCPYYNQSICNLTFVNGSWEHTQQQLTCENYLNSITAIDNDLTMIATILTQIMLIVFLVFTGVMQVRHYVYYDMQKTSFWLAFTCLSLAVVEIILTLGIVYVNEVGGAISDILYIQLWTVGFIAFIVGMAVLSRIMFGLMDITGDQETIKEW